MGGFGVGGEEWRGGGDVERGVDDDCWGFAGGEARKTPIVEALEEEGQVGEGVVHGEDYLGGEVSCRFNGRGQRSANHVQTYHSR